MARIRNRQQFSAIDPDRLHVADGVAGADAVAHREQRVDDGLRRAACS